MNPSSIGRYLPVMFLLPLALAAQQPKQAAAPVQKNCWLRDANSPAPATAYLLCEQGQMWVTTDAGATWTQRNTGAKSRLRAFSWVDASRGLVVGNGGLVLATNDGGKTWQPRDSGVEQHLMDITFVGEAGWIAGYQGLILHTTDGGKTWVRQPTGTTMTLEGIFFLDADHGWAVGWSGTILRTVDGGKTWKQVKTDASQWSLFAACFIDVNHGWVTGFAGQLLRTTDGGVTWKRQDTPVKDSLNSISFDNSGRGWITYDDGFLLSEDKGETWKPASSGGRYFLGKLLPVGKAMWAVGQSVVLQQAGNGKEWKKINSLVANSSATELQSSDRK
jgi:photosystem II stability/assembly factor-like uncharacterized protein